MSPRGRPPRLEVYQRLDVQIDELRQRLGGLPNPQEAADIWRGIWFEEAHHSTAIEGNTLVLKQVEQLLAEGRAVGNKELSEYLEVKGYADAAEWVYGQAIEPTYVSDEPLTLTEIRQVHQLAMQPVWDVAPHPGATAHEGPGEFRRHDIHPFPGGMVPPSWVLVAGEMRSWLVATRALRAGTVEFPEQVAELHCRFEQIHPFLDGNGRTGRLVLNLLLIRLGYPPVIIYKQQRARYLRALRRADAGDCGELGELIARAILDNLYRFVVPAIAGPARLVPLAALATSGISSAALRAAAVRGALQAAKGTDGQWRSSRNWVDEYAAARKKRRGRPRIHQQWPSTVRPGGHVPTPVWSVPKSSLPSDESASAWQSPLPTEHVPSLTRRTPMSLTVTVDSLDVPGARLYHEVRGHGPLVVLVGAPMDAAPFASLAELLAVDHTVLTTDTRGINRSPADDPDQDSTLDLRADDLSRLLAHLDAGPAVVLGSSGGAVSALALVQAHPEQVHTVVAHEPPLTELLEDRDSRRAESEDVIATYRSGDTVGAWRMFLANANITLPDGAFEMMFAVERDPQQAADERFFFLHQMRFTSGWQPDIAALRDGPTRIVVGIGEASAGQFCERTSTALADALGVAPTMFPGGHTGFAEDPGAFATRLRAVLESS